MGGMMYVVVLLGGLGSYEMGFYVKCFPVTHAHSGRILDIFSTKQVKAMDPALGDPNQHNRIGFASPLSSFLFLLELHIPSQ